MRVLTLTKHSPRLTVETLADELPDLIVCKAYPYILTPDLYKFPEHGTVNVHLSLLPKYRGRHPVVWAMIEGEQTIGVTLHYIDEGIDTGPIISQAWVRLDPNMTYNHVNKTLWALGDNMVEDFVGMLEQGADVQGRTQPYGESSRYPRRVPGDSRIRCIGDMTARDLACYINALTDPMPNAYIQDDTGTLYFKEVRFDPAMD